jgi:hypothetical protein
MRLDYSSILRHIEMNEILEYAEQQQLTLTKNFFLQRPNFIFSRQHQKLLW